MSHDASDNMLPQPGACALDPGQKYEDVFNGVPNIKTVGGKEIPNHFTAPGWPTLPADLVVNFVDRTLRPVRIKPTIWVEPEDTAPWVTEPFPPWRIEDPDTGQLIDTKPLYRVWGDWAVAKDGQWLKNWAAWDSGRWWTDDAPQEEKDFYGNTAVGFSWNAGRYVAELKNTGLFTEIRAWRGKVAVQRAEGMDAQHRPIARGKFVPDYYLPGGYIQHYIPDALPYFDDERTHWNPVTQLFKRPDLGDLQPPKKGDAATPEHYKALADVVDHLANLLESTNTTGQAAILRANVDQLREGSGLRQEAFAQAQSKLKLSAQSLVPIARYLDGYPGTSYGETRDVIADVVKWAYAIGIAAE